MFDPLDAPADLGSARARLRAAAERLAGPAPVAHLHRGGGDRSHGARGSGPPAWPGIDPGAGVVVADTVLWGAAPADLVALAQALGPERSLLFLEPTAEVGWRRLVHRLGSRLWRRAVGHHFETDVPAALRAAGLEVVDLRRFGVGRARVRSYVLGRALRFDEVDELGAAVSSGRS